MPFHRPLAWLCLVGFVVIASPAQADEPARSAETAELEFERDIRPIFRTYCFDCHGAHEEKQGSLDLRLVRFLLTGGESGPALVPGHPESSYLLARVRQGEMPPGEGKVPPELITRLEQWIAAGAPVAQTEPESLPAGVGISASERQWWAFRPIERPAIPELPGQARLRGPIDALLAAQMPEGLDFAPEADRRTLIIRLSFDLLGLPPSPDEIAQFVGDEAPGAYERLVDRLLASPHYGERWARHWLDVAGYADSEGGPDDPVRPWIYQYRDYVIRSLNDDKPLDQFLIEQLAGDELAGPLRGDLTPGQIELLSATGFLRLAADPTGGGDNSPEGRERAMADTLKIIGSSLLGLTMACAQCHDHRYDPISQVDYYALRAVFDPAWNAPAWRTPGERQVSLATEADRQRSQEIEKQAAEMSAARAERERVLLAEALAKELEKFEEPLRNQLKAALDKPGDQRTPDEVQLLAANPQLNITPGVLYQYNPEATEELKKLDAEIAAVRAQKPAESFLAALVEPAGASVETHRFHRGDYRQPQEVIAPGTLSVLSPTGLPLPLEAQSTPAGTSGRRLAWARWLVGPDNPLTTRALVNRVWLHHFGRGLVPTPADFGRLGVPPSQPALLDWLASQLRQQGFRLKRLHREIVTSTAYRQQSRTSDAERALDPDNRYVARQQLRRLDAESLRDRVLAVSGHLDRTLYGPAVATTADDAGQVVVAEPDSRRSLYIQQRRSTPVALLEAFDAPVMQTNCEARSSSTAATQSLLLMNGDFLVRETARLADRLLAAAPSEPVPTLTAWGPPRLPPVWQFGYGGCDEASGRTASFTPLAHWTGSSWQAGEQLPDAGLGWVFLGAEGGHPGENPHTAAIRRWTAPAAGSVAITGKLVHPSPHGDGVRGRIVSSRWGLVATWSVAHGETETNVAEIAVEPGDTLDLITDCLEHVTSDSFQWPVELALTQNGALAGSFHSAAQFHGPVGPSVALLPEHVTRLWQACFSRLPSSGEEELAGRFLANQLQHLRLHPEHVTSGRAPEQQALANLAHVLLSSNEFLYVD